MSQQRQALWWASGAVLVGALGWVGWKRWRGEDAESPDYRLLASKNGLEVRQYSPMLLAATDLEGGFSQALNEGFHRLAHYIFGGNRREQSLPMTAPVGLQRWGDAWRVSFVMPAALNLDTVPAPLDKRIHLQPVPGRRMAVRRFSGVASEAVTQAEQAWLLAELRRQGLKPVSEPMLAQYNSPFVPGFLRRNEILVEVQPLDWVH